MVNPKLLHAIAHRLAVAKIAGLNPSQTDAHNGPCLLARQRLKSGRERDASIAVFEEPDFQDFHSGTL